MTIHESKRLWLACGVGLVWFLILLWPMLGIKPDELEFATTFKVFGYVAVAAVFIMFLLPDQGGGLPRRRGRARQERHLGRGQALREGPHLAAAGHRPGRRHRLPLVTQRYAHDVAISVLIYICLGLGLNIVIGLAGLLDLGYIAFYGVGAYTYAILSVNFGLSFWLCLPISAFMSRPSRAVSSATRPCACAATTWPSSPSASARSSGSS